MKKLVLIAFALMLSTAVFAQVEKGDINLSGSLSYIKYPDIDGMGQFDAKGGYFLTQNLELGTSLQLYFMKDVGVGIGPYASYNFLTEDAKLMPYAGAGFSFLAIAGISATSVGVNGGVKYFLTEKINIDSGITLQQSFGDLKGTMFMARVGIGFIMGKLN